MARLKAGPSVTSSILQYDGSAFVDALLRRIHRTMQSHSIVYAEELALCAFCKLQPSFAGIAQSVFRLLLQLHFFPVQEYSLFTNSNESTPSTVLTEFYRPVLAVDDPLEQSAPSPLLAQSYSGVDIGK